MVFYLFPFSLYHFFLVPLRIKSLYYGKESIVYQSGNFSLCS
jgi:hypothetical protein